MWSAARSAKISMILCMPERVSGGDAKFQGFCHRWNKWEGQFGSERLTGALLDRLTHHVNILEMNGDSYRLNQSRRRQTPTAN